jgi:hypothetical protein
MYDVQLSYREAARKMLICVWATKTGDMQLELPIRTPINLGKTAELTATIAFFPSSIMFLRQHAESGFGELSPITAKKEKEILMRFQSSLAKSTWYQHI